MQPNYFINVTDLRYDSPQLYQRSQLTLRFTSTLSTQPTYFTLYLFFYQRDQFTLQFTSNLSTQPTYSTLYLFFINATNLH